MNSFKDCIIAESYIQYYREYSCELTFDFILKYECIKLLKERS